MMKLLRATVLVVVLLYNWSASGYVGCTESHPPESQPQLLPAQDASPEQEPMGGLSPHPTVQETWVAQGLPDEQLAEPEPVEEELGTPQGSSEHEEQHAEVFEMEEPVADEELNLVRQLEPEALPELPETSVPQDQDPALPFDLVPPNPAPHTSTTTSQDLSPSSSVQEEDLADVPVEDPVDGDVAPVDCEAEEVNPYDSSSPPVVEENLSNVHVGGTDPLLGPQTASTTPAPSQQGGNTSHMLKEQGLRSPKPESDSSSTGSKDPEDIPTFDEWKRKMMEVEKEKIQATHTSSNGGSNPVKKVQKNFNNYASVECGAKILGSNPEAKSTSAILMENMDMYMLNPCSNKIWFIIELCEPIQVKQLDIANFELFSSTPKDFLVSISDRYPTNKWLKLGTFHGRDERTVQTFPLDEHLYAKYVKMFTKYIKVELLSHFGSEHFCPLSLIRVFGTSMVEEYEEIADPSERPDDPDDDYDYPRGYVPAEDKSSNNIIGSAKDVILNMVSNIAVNVLGGTPGQEGNFSSQALNVTESSSPTELLIPTPTPLIPELEAEEVEHPDVPVAPGADTPAPEPPAPELAEAELPLVDETVVTPIHEEEDDPSTVPTVTLLEGEEEEEEEERLEREEEQRQRDRRQESLDYCGPSSSCSPSLQEYIHRHCSAMLATTRLHQPLEKPVAPHQALPPGRQQQQQQQQQQLSPSACPAPPKPHAPYPHPEDQDQEAVPGPRELDVSPTVVTPPTEERCDTWGTDGGSESLLLEPSQTSTFLPQPSAVDPPAARPTPAEEMPVAPTKDFSQELPVESQDTSVDSVWLAPTASASIPSATVEQGWAPPAEERPGQEVNLPDAPARGPDEAAPPPPAPTAPPAAEPQPPPPAEPPEAEVTTPDPAPEHEASGSPLEAKVEDLVLVEELLLSSSNGGDGARPSSSSSSSSSSSQPRSDVYAELHVPAEPAGGSGSAAYGSSQKESVFMRLNNRIKALEMNMSLSGRYLEQLSQRYRKQMEEMQRAFNITVIKLQNTSRIAEEQDQRQTESIQALQGQLENVTRLVLDLSVRVSLLQSEVADRQSYLLLCLALGLLLGLLLCANHCRMSALPSATDPEPPDPDSYSFCCPDRSYSPYEETGLKRCASFPLMCSDSLQLPTTQGPESLHTVEPKTFSPANQKSKTKANEHVVTLMPTSLSAPELANGAAASSRSPLTLDPSSLPSGPPHPAFRHPPSEGSSEGSSHSDDPSFCGLATACTRLCDGLPPPRGRADKRAFKRRRSKPSCAVVDLMQAPRRDQREAKPVPILQDIMKGNKKLSSGALGVTAL